MSWTRSRNRARRRLVSRILAGLLLLPMLASCGLHWGEPPAVPAGTRAQPGENIYTGEVGGVERRWRLYAPLTSDADPALPLVIVLHGGRGDYSRLAAYGWDELAERDRFLLITPDAYEGYWNDGRNDSQAESREDNVDDVGFIRYLIELTSRQFDVDRRRIYVAGISNGAMMSARVACDLSDTVAAVGLVAGSMGRETASICSPQRPVSMINLSGTNDRIVPFEGGEIRVLGRYRGHVIGASATAEFWGQIDGCQRTELEAVPDRVTRDSSTIMISRRTDCTAMTEVDLYVISGAGHTWPGSRSRRPDGFVGGTNLDVDAAEVIWRFFAEHPQRRV